MLKTEASYKQIKNQRRRKTGIIPLEPQNSIMLKDMRLRDRLSLVRVPLAMKGMICDLKHRIKGAKDR